MSESLKNYNQNGVKSWDARIALRDLNYQTGGLLKIDMQLNNERHLQGKSKEELLKDMEMELAEVIGIALFTAAEMNLDISRGFEQMLELDRKKVKERIQQNSME